MQEINFSDIKISKANKELAKLVRRDVDEALSRYASWYILAQEAYLEFHGVGVKQFTQGDSFYYIETVDESGNIVQKKIYDRPVKLRIAYSAVNAGMAQVNRTVPDFLVDCDDYVLKDLAKSTCKLVQSEWVRGRVQKEVDMAWWNAFLFGEMVFRTYVDENERIRHDMEGNPIDPEKDEEFSKVNRAKMVNSFEFLPSPEWRGNIQDVPFLGIRTFKTAEEIARIYHEEFKDAQDVKEKARGTGLTAYNILDPFSMIRKLYTAKVDPETRDLMGSMLSDMNSSALGDLPEDLIEVNEYFRKDIDARVVMIGYDYIVEAEYMDDDFYPIVAHKTNVDALTARGLGDVMQALPLTKTVDDLFDLKMKNLALQLSSVLLYNEDYFQQTPSFGPGTALGVKLRPGDNLETNVIAQVSKYGQNFEITKEQKDFESKIFVLMGINEFLAGTPSTSTETTAREAMIRNAAATANLDYKMRRVEAEVYTEIANHFVAYIAEYFDVDYVFSLMEDGDNGYFMYLGDVEVESKENYRLYKYKGKKFWEPLIGKMLLDQALNSFGAPESMAVDNILNVADSPSLDGMTPPLDQESPEENSVPEGMDGRWSDFINKFSDLTGGKIKGIVTRGDLNTVVFKFGIRAVQGIMINRVIKQQQLMQLIPFVAQLKLPKATLGILKALLELTDEVPSDVIGDITGEDLAAAQQQGTPQQDGEGQSSGQAAMSMNTIGNQTAAQ